MVEVRWWCSGCCGVSWVLLGVFWSGRTGGRWGAGGDEPTVVPATGTTSTRGTGVAELAQAIRGDRSERVPGELAFHVLDVMVSLAESAERHEGVVVASTLEPTPELPEDWDPTVPTLG